MHKSEEITRLIHENLSIVVMFAFGERPAKYALQKHFKGEWKFLHQMIYQISEQRADRALLEMATQLRILDNSDQLAGNIKSSFGNVTQGDWTVTELYFRDMTNKIIHGSEFKWDSKEEYSPRIVVTSDDEKRWRHAQIEVQALMALGGMLMF
jgi:hypothetical protein